MARSAYWVTDFYGSLQCGGVLPQHGSLFGYGILIFGGSLPRTDLSNRLTFVARYGSMGA
jgi:hypothetical protein